MSDLGLRQLRGYSERIATLLGKPEIHSKDSLIACLDDLLGVVYSLFHAKRLGYDERPQPLQSRDINAVLVRATDMANGRVRRDGKWTAGYYVNSALLRLGSVYHRALNIVVGASAERFEVSLRRARVWFRSSCGADWSSLALRKVNDEVVALKHAPDGIFTGRRVTFDDIVQATEEILVLLEVFQLKGFQPVCQPTREECVGAIEHLVYEYANLMSAAFWSLNGSAPWRTHADDAFLLGYRKLGDFLLLSSRRYPDEILAIDFLPTQLGPSWKLQIWTEKWRSVMNKQLTHLTYARASKPQPWDHTQWIPRLEAEFRSAWTAFWGSVSDSEFLSEYQRQIDKCRSNPGFSKIQL